MTFYGKGILRLAADASLKGDIFCGHAHGVSAVKLFHARVGVTPSEGSIVGGEVAKSKALFSFGEGVWRTGHAFHAAGQVDLTSTTADGLKGHVYRRQARGAQAVHGGSRNAGW